MAIRKLLGRGELQLYGHSTYFLGLLKESVSMNVVKRSEYCNGVSGEVKKDYMLLRDIPQGTVFRARIGGNARYKHVWIKTANDAICIGEPGVTSVFLGDVPYLASETVYDYKVLNATLVIED